MLGLLAIISVFSGRVGSRLAPKKYAEQSFYKILSLWHCLRYIVLYFSSSCSGNHLCLLYFLLLPLAKPITEKTDVRPHQNRIFDKFLHAIHQTISVAARHELLISRLTFIWKLCICPRDRGLIRNSKHTHPPTQDTQGVDGIERLRSTAHLGNGKRSALSRTNTSCGQRNPIDLILEDSGLALRRKSICQ